MSFYRKSYRPRRGGEEPEKCADPAKARARALDALSAREMTSTQLYERLCARFTEQSAAAAVAEMVELDYVNDDRYAETRAHGLLMARKSRRAAAQNLRQKGLNSQQIEQALETVYAPDENGESPELEAAAALVKAGKVKVNVAQVPQKLYIEVIAKGGGHTGRAIVRDLHTNVVLVEQDGAATLDKRDTDTAAAGDSDVVTPEQIASFLTVRSIWDYCTKELDPMNDPIDICLLYTSPSPRDTR